ncbi:MAG: diacylglycerol kinase [Candidatus Aureabacteria bacterium]|nr:diacylglycerol kinase [Candidatus Auribacterota bacterium]
MKCFLILNPGSKNGKSRNSINRIINDLKNTNLSFDYKMTQTLKDACLFSKEANYSDKYDAVIAVGGDGTINQTLNGFYDDKGRRISKTKMGVIYTGTSPDFCRNYNIPVDPEKSIRTLLNQKSRFISIGRIECSSSESMYFSCAVNIGIGPELARSANSGIRAKLGDFFGTFYSLLKILYSFKPGEYEMTIDNNKQKLSGIYNISIGKGYNIASGIKVSNSLTDTSDNLYILKIQNLNIFNIPNVLYTVYSGGVITNNKYLELSYGKEITVSNLRTESEIEFDGDPHGFLPCKIKTAEDKLELITD